MFHELTDELLDLDATEKGVGLAFLAATDGHDGAGSSSSSTLSSSLCCSLHLCI